MRNPKTAKGKRRLYEVCCVMWVDLLGYGSMLAEVNFDPTAEQAKRAIGRLMSFHDFSSRFAHRYFPIHAINDGVVVFRDLSPRTKSVTFDFIDRAIDYFDQLNKIEMANGFPGARMVIAAGFRVRVKNGDSTDEHGKVKVIKNKVSKGLITPEQAIIESYHTRPNFGLIPELQANFAFTKAYLVDSGGSKEGFGGPNCFIDLSLFSEPKPDWITFEKEIHWEKMGMQGTFGQLKALDRGLANSSRHQGVLDAFEIASKISVQGNITNVLVGTTIKKDPLSYK